MIVTPLWSQTHKATTPPTDTQIEAQVQKAIDNDHAFSGSSILSGVNKGVVKLTGVQRHVSCDHGVKHHPCRFTAVPNETPVIGRIVDAKAAGHFTGASQLVVELVSVRLPGSSGAQDVSLVTEHLSNKAAGRGANTAEKAGGGAAFGAVVGAITGGGAGAGIGAASGGALGLGANAITKGKEIDLRPEQLLQFRTAAPLDVTIILQNGQQVTPGRAVHSGPNGGTLPQQPSQP